MPLIRKFMKTNNLREDDIPQQEIFILINGKEIFWDDIEKMSNTQLSKLMQWIQSNKASLECLDLSHDPEQQKKLCFKIKMYAIFLREANLEREYRRNRDKNAPCQWLGEFGLPVSREAFSTVYGKIRSSRQCAKKINSAFYELVSSTVGEEKAQELYRTAKVEAGVGQFEEENHADQLERNIYKKTSFTPPRPLASRS
jgi:hypothetical protein